MILFFLSLVGVSGVALGAVGKHMLQAQLTEAQFNTFSTAVHYHQLYSVLLLIIFYIHALKPSLVPKSIVTIFLIGITLFSGSLYAHIFTQWHFWVYITPIGGFTLMGAWIWAAISARVLKKFTN